MTSPQPDAVTAYLAEVRERADAATPGPWWSDESEQCWRLHGVHARLPAPFEGWPEQIMNHQIAKAPKSGTSYAEYWPDAADDAFITSARTDVPRLLAAVEAAFGHHRRRDGNIGCGCPEHQAAAAAELGRCSSCYDEYGELVDWPCKTARAISRALLGGSGG